jgi:hypothetical protein
VQNCVTAVGEQRVIRGDMLNESLSTRGKAAVSAENARRCLEAADAKAAEKRPQRVSDMGSIIGLFGIPSKGCADRCRQFVFRFL